MGEQKTPISVQNRSYRWLAGLTAAAGSFILGLTISRLLYEGLFPRWIWTGESFSGLIIPLSAALIGWLGWRSLSRYLSHAHSAATNSHNNGSSSHENSISRWYVAASLPFLSYYLNLLYLMKPGVSLLESRFLLFATLWLFLLMLVRLLSREEKWTWIGVLFSLVLLLPIYLLTMGNSVGQADTFEFQVIVPQLGIAHPTGYPLYLLLSKPFTWLPINSIAWRVNLGTMVFGLAAVCVLYLLLFRLTRRPVIGVISAALFGLTPTFWSQSIEAEVYSLNLFIVLSALLIMRQIGDWKFYADESSGGASRQSGKNIVLVILLSLCLGLGLTNHLTTIILIPGALLTIIFAFKNGRLDSPTWELGKVVLLALVAFLLPLLLYAYLPLRWSAVNQEAMGLQRFIDWVIGGRFQGALQLKAWLQDPLRYEILLRLFEVEWPWLWFFPFALAGLVWSYLRDWKFASILLISWIGYVFYSLNYYVPDLAVFVLPAFAITALWWALGLVGFSTAALSLINRYSTNTSTSTSTLPMGVGYITLLLIVLLAPFFAAVTGNNWDQVDASKNDGRVQWGQAVLDLPLAAEAAILADSDKFPPLYYLQQVEGLRQDLDILVLPDEATYRNELDKRIAEGETVYLARFLPGLEGTYKLRSVGPLIEVTHNTSVSIPSSAARSDLAFGPIQLLGYELESPSPFHPREAGLTLYWQSSQPLAEVQHIFLRWSGPGGNSSPSSGHPVNNYYPTVAWEPEEVISDFHSLLLPLVNEQAEIALQVAVGRPFSNVEELDWQNITSITPESALDEEKLMDHRIRLGSVDLDGASFSSSTRPGDDLEIVLSGSGPEGEEIVISLESASGSPDDGDGRGSGSRTIEVITIDDDRFLRSVLLPTDLPTGAYDVVVRHPRESSRCGWLAKLSSGCSLGSVEISGVELPKGAVNFDDKIALLSADYPEDSVRSGEVLDVHLRWRALATMDKDFTVFLQVVNEEDRIVGQVDSWPVQGTYPTSSWKQGEIVDDGFQVQLGPDLEAGSYRLLIGWYLLEDLKRLPLINDDGQPIDDKLDLPGLFIPQE